jgi:hypothetical protein
MTVTLIIIQLVAGFIVAMLGVILMLHTYMITNSALDIWTGLLIALVGIFFVLRAGHRLNKCN